jgi:exo-beta-1,3-glucanase (GH17 family)
MDLIEGFTEAIHADQLKGLNAIKDFSDVLGISIYPYLSIFLTNPLPDNLFAQIFSLTDKPLAICETGYPAEQFSIEGGTFQFNGTPQKQKSYFENLLQAASDYEVEFIINFVLQDYDSLWTAIGSPDDFQKLWRDTGFYDEDGTEREVFNIWRENLGRVKK